jgi:hypothetical protein
LARQTALWVAVACVAGLVEGQALAAEGQLVLVSTPSGAEVFVDGKSVGVAPVVVPRLAEGQHVVEARWPDKRTTASLEEVTAGGTRVVELIPAAPAPPPVAAPSVAAPPVAAPPVAAPPIVAPPPVVAAPAVPIGAPPPAKPVPVYQKAWLWAVVGVGVAAVAVGVGLGVGLGTSSSPSRAGILEF